MRILLVNDYGTASGGAELQMLEIRELLRARGHDVRLLTSDALLVDGYPVEADRSCSGRTDLGQVATQTINISAWRALGNELRDHPPDVVHVRMFLWQLSPAILQRLADVPVLYQAAVYKAVCPTGFKMFPDGRPCRERAGTVCRTEGCVSAPTWLSTMTQLRLLDRWRDRIDHLAVLSEKMRTIFAESGWPDATVLGNGIHVPSSSQAPAARPRVGYAGRFSREKGVETLIDAFAEAAADVADAELVLAGSGPLDAELRERAAPLGDRVRFLGHLDRETMEREFASLWVQAVPSLWDEPFGNVTTEAMARGTAIVASDVGGQRDLVRENLTGNLVPPGDVSALGDRLRTILGDRRLAERLGAGGRAVAAEEYAWEPVIDRLVDTYRLTIDHHGRRHHGRQR